MWQHLKKFLRSGATEAQAKVGESSLQTALQALTLVQQQSALLADYRMIVQRYEKLTSVMPHPPAVVHADSRTPNLVA